MSRCFPFPPPGYEKARIDNADLLKKEKQKEKKHKKDKKEKEKREGKEKQAKDGRKEKHKDKKDRKEKHKDKDRDRDKEKNRTSNEKKVEGQPGLSNGEKLGSNSLQNGDNKDKNSLYVQELANRIRDDDRASGSQMVQKVFATDQTRAVVWTMVEERSISNQFEENEKVKNRIEDYGKLNGQRNHIDTRGLEKAFGQNFSGLDKKIERVAAIKLEEKKDVEKQMEGKEKSKHKESDGKSDKLKEREREKNKKSKDKNRSKEEKKKAKEIIEPSKERPKLNENVCNAHEKLNLANVSPAAEGNLGKRKEHERNGYLLDNGNRPNKFPRNLSSSHPVVENGKKLETCQTAVELTSEKGLANNHRVDIKDQKINGLIAAHPPIKCSAKRSSAGILETGEIFSKLPHPDAKYLSQVLSIPETEEWLDVNNQEWLFSSINSESKKPSMGSSWIEGSRQVWAEAFRIESADISALPYVIPY